MLKKANGDYKTTGDDMAGGDIMLKSHDQELIFDAGNDQEEGKEDAKNIDDMNIEVGGGRDTDSNVLHD